MVTRVCTSNNELLLGCPLVLLMMMRGFLMLLLLLRLLMLKFVIRRRVSLATAASGCITLNRRSRGLAFVEEGWVLVGHLLLLFLLFLGEGFPGRRLFFSPWKGRKGEKNVGGVLSNVS